MPLDIVRRKSTGALTISGTVGGQRIQRRAQSNRLALAREEAAALEVEILRTGWHGERRGARSFNEALISYLEAQTRSESEKRRLSRIRDALGGEVQLAAIDQDAAVRLRRAMLRSGSSDSTYAREVVTPLRAVLRHAAARGWCDEPRFAVAGAPLGRTLYMTPGEAGRLTEAAAPHLRPLLVFLIGTGARMSEALELEWRDVDLTGGRAIFWRTKNGKRRVVHLPAAVAVSLANLRWREGRVFRHARGTYEGRDRGYGGQIKTAWRAAIRRAGLDPALTPHDCRHTWASWHYAIHKDLLALKQEGGWSGVTLVERYAHLMPAGHERGIEQYLAGAPRLEQESAA
jgi:integrase